MLINQMQSRIVLLFYILACFSCPFDLAAFGIAKPKTDSSGSSSKPMSVRGREVVHRGPIERSQANSHRFRPAAKSSPSTKQVAAAEVPSRPSSYSDEGDAGAGQDNAFTEGVEGPFYESERFEESKRYVEAESVKTDPIDFSQDIEGPFYEPIDFDESEFYIEPVAVERSDYRIKVGDAFLISIYGEEQTDREVIVDPRGMISYLFVDALPVAGKTIDQVREDLAEELRKRYRFATLSITPVKFSAEYYAVAGQVVQPGKQPLIGNPTVLSALCKAQGFSTIDYRDQLYDLCNLEKSFLARQGNYLPVDFTKLVKHGDLSQNLPLEAGDFIYVPERTINQVYVVGEVLQPLSIEYFDDMSLVEAIAETGDVLERASSRVLIIRGSLHCPVRYLVDYKRIVKGCYPDFKLQPGDIVYVPPRKLYLVKEIFRAALASFITTVAYETGIELFIQSHPHAEQDLGDRIFVPGGVVMP